jgi:hypothetical protein
VDLTLINLRGTEVRTMLATKVMTGGARLFAVARPHP